MLSKASFWLKFHTIYWDSIIQTESYNSEGLSITQWVATSIIFFNEIEWNKIYLCFMWISQKKKKKKYHNKYLVSVHTHEHTTTNTQPHTKSLRDYIGVICS